MVVGLIIGLIIALARTTYFAYKLYKKNRELILVNQDISNNYQLLNDAWMTLCDDNDYLIKKLAGKQETLTLLIEDKQSLMNTVKILQEELNAK